VHRHDGPLTAADTVLHFLRPARVGPVEARCQVLGDRADRALVRVAMHDLGAGDRLITLGSVLVWTD
jgi:acyl-coenzyme A thioesterase PaaI-like protein